MPNLTVKQMFTAMAGLVLVLLLLIGGVGQYSASRLEHAVDHAIHSSSVQRTQMDADMMHDAIRSDLLSALLAAGDATRRQAAANDLAQHAARLRKDVEEIAGADLQTATRQQAEKVRPVLERYLASAQANLQGGGQLAAFEQDFDLLETEMERLSDLIQAETDSSHGEADAALGANRWGSGFAVVADEVRKLAERTGKSTQEISAMINDMQASTRNAVSTMNDGVQRVEMGVELAGQAGRTIAQVAHNAGSAAEAVGDITHALREQNAAGQEIARRVEQVAQLAEESHAAAQASTQHADELARLAVALDTTVGRFKV